MLSGAGIDLQTQRPCTSGSIGDVSLILVRDRNASEGFVQEMVNEVHLRRSVTLGTIDLTIKSGVCHIELCLPNVGEF